MFVTKSQDVEHDSLQSWYGEPQYDEEGTNEWEIEYYGGTNDENPAGPVEFDPEIEYPGEFRESDRAPEGQPARPLSASD